jgi:hypothetical protein
VSGLFSPANPISLEGDSIVVGLSVQLVRYRDSDAATITKNINVRFILTVIKVYKIYSEGGGYNNSNILTVFIYLKIPSLI